MSGFLVSKALQGGGLAPTGSTGSNTHASHRVSPACRSIGAEVVIEAVGATPQITAKLQGSIDDDQTADGSAQWFDLAVIPSDSDTAAATAVRNPTAVGASLTVYVSQSQSRVVRRVRLVTSANTNTTYRANLIQAFNN